MQTIIDTGFITKRESTLSVSVSVSVSFSLSVSVSVSFSLSVSVPVSFSLSVSVPVSFSLFVSVSVSFSLCLSVSLCLYFSPLRSLMCVCFFSPLFLCKGVFKTTYTCFLLHYITFVHCVVTMATAVLEKFHTHV